MQGFRLQKIIDLLVIQCCCQYTGSFQVSKTRSVEVSFVKVTQCALQAAS